MLETKVETTSPSGLASEAPDAPEPWEYYFLGPRAVAAEYRLRSRHFPAWLLDRVVSAKNIRAHEHGAVFGAELIKAIGDEPFLLLPEGTGPAIEMTINERVKLTLHAIIRRPPADRAC